MGDGDRCRHRLGTALAFPRQHHLYLRPEPQGHGSLRPTLAALRWAGCESKVGPGSDPEGDEEGNDVGALRDRLERLSSEQDAKASGSDGSSGACEDLCSLASSICTVKEKLCEVADRHPGEEEYQGLCLKAELECSQAEGSCVACVESRESRESREEVVSK